MSLGCVILSQVVLGFVFACIGTEFAGNDALGRRFEDQEEHDPLDVLPFFG